jgi:hypothetical protein
VHTLVGGGGQHGGFDALDYRKIKHGDAGKLGNYSILSVLPDNFARFLFEFHDYRFLSLDRPCQQTEATLMCMECWRMRRQPKTLISIEYVPCSFFIYYDNYSHYSHYFYFIAIIPYSGILELINYFIITKIFNILIETMA